LYQATGDSHLTVVNRRRSFVADEPTASLDSERALTVIRILEQMANIATVRWADAVLHVLIGDLMAGGRCPGRSARLGTGHHSDTPGAGTVPALFRATRLVGGGGG
jgi:hypothetical protein